MVCHPGLSTLCSSRRRLSEVLARGEIHDPELARFSITVGEVRTSPDLKVATAYVLPLGGDNRDEALEALRRNRSELRRASLCPLQHWRYARRSITILQKSYIYSIALRAGRLIP